MIKVDNISKSFGSVKAVDEISFEVQGGEVVGFLGPNGAGKTTTMRLMTGYLAADQGEVIINDVSVSENPIEVRKQIGYLPESNPLYRDMLVSEFLDLSANIKETPSQSVGFVVEATGIGDVFYQPIGELSKGYRQRVGLATALLGEPKVLIMDEPTEGLDPNQRGEIRALIKGLAKDRTVVMSTHVMQEAAAVCNRLLIINHGQLVADGTPEELSSAARGGRVISLDVQGQDVDAKVRGLASVDEVEANKVGPSRYQVKLMVGEATGVRLELSRLARENEWIIWELFEERRGLEEIFRELTGGS